jgi:RNA polymerase sigma factor (sigma-70 family)
MFSICVRMMNSREEAEDLLQEAFSEAFHQLVYFRYESAFGAWLKRIVINRCINALKRKKAELVLFDDFYKFDHAAEEKDNFEEDTQLTVKKIHAAVEKLPDGYRVIFSLYMFEGYDHGEIAQILSISESTSKSQYLRAKHRIKEILRDNTTN